MTKRSTRPKRRPSPKPGKRGKSVRAVAPPELGTAIMEARKAAGLSQIALAERLGTSQSNIARLEKGGGLPSCSTLQKIAAATGHDLVITFIRRS
jgi:ribosome-binding protein aMBF1 (putative translation factor)